jgi:hypothetical protein
MTAIPWKERVAEQRQALTLDWTLILQGTTLYLLAFAIFAMLLFSSPAFFSTDDYYHARVSEQMVLQGKLNLDFPWLPLTILSPERFVDHHLLYHMWIAYPVYWWGMTGAKLATVALAAAGVLAAWIMLRGIHVRCPAIWALGIFGSASTFLFRSLMIRVPVFGVLLLFLVLHVMFQKKYKWLVPLAFLFTWLYSSGVVVLLGSFIACYCAATFFTERRIAWQPVVYTVLGMVLGFVINPFFPQNIGFIAENLLPKVDLENSVPVGAEWYPLQTRALMSIATGSLVALIAGVLRASFGGKRDRVEFTLLLTTLMTLLMTFNSMRFLEYFPPFAVLFCAAAWGRDEWVLKWTPWAPLKRIRKLVWPFALIAIISYFGVSTVHYVYRMAQSSRDPLEFAGAATWLERNTPEGTLVMSTGFNDFSRLYFYNQSNNWVIGLDPTYLQLVSPRMWDEYYAMTMGRVTNPSRLLAGTFGTQYVVSWVNHDFVPTAEADPNMQLVFRDRYNTVWKVNDDYFAANAVDPVEVQRAEAAS